MHPDAMLPYASLQDRAARDPHYAHLASADYALLAQAGFTDDGLSQSILTLGPSDPSWLTTPLGKLRRNLAAGGVSARPAAVLLTTGGFAPVHDGHVAMMEAAREACEAAGYRVVGGYMSPSHDAYVSKKHGGDPTLLAPFRIGLLEKRLHASDWLDVDPWEARYVPCDLNFTDVLRRLDRYLHWHLCPVQPLTLFYVFGGDNAGFVRAFDRIGHAICVARPGQEATVAPMREHAGRNPRVLFAPSGLIEDVASRKLRPSGAHLPKPLPNRASGLKAAPTGVTGLYLVRDDLAAATRAWSKRWPGYAEATSRFREAVLGILADAYREARPAMTEGPVAIRLIDLDHQRAQAAAVLAGRASLSFDVHIQGAGPDDRAIAMTRAFDLAAGQIQTDRFVARPGHPDLKAQFAAVPPGSYVLVEDDIGSGRTLQEIEDRLPAGVTLSDVLLLNGFRPEPDAPVFDVVDLRDFLLGAEHGGLTVEMPDGSTARAPYMLPFVSLRSRAKIPPSTEWATAVALWQANAVFFQDSGLTLADAAPATRRLLAAAGHVRETTQLLQICEEQVARLINTNLARQPR